MKNILKWTSLVFAIIVVGFSLYALVSTVTMGDWQWQWPDMMPLLIVSFVVIPSGAIFLCIGAFKRSRTLLIVGAIIFIFGVAILIFTYIMSSDYARRRFSQ